MSGDDLPLVWDPEGPATAHEASIHSPLPRTLAPPEVSSVAGGYNTANFEMRIIGANAGFVVDRASRPRNDGYDLTVLPSNAVYAAVTGVEATWLPGLLHEFERSGDGAQVQRLAFSGHVAQAGSAEDRELAEMGFGECMESMGRVGTADLVRWQRANIQAQRDPGQQDRPLVFDGPSTWDAARRAKLRQLFEEVYARVSDPFGPRGPHLEEFWARLEPLLPPVEAVGPGRLVHCDGKLGNVVLAGEDTTVIDWDLAAVTFAAPEQAAVIDLVRYLHLDGRNPLTTPPDLWLPSANTWARSVPDARRPVDQCTSFWGEVGQEATFALAQSAATDFLRNCDGSVPPSYAANAVAALLPMLGQARVPVRQLHAKYASLHGQAAGHRLIGAEPVQGPDRLTKPRSSDDVVLEAINRQTELIRDLAAALADIRHPQSEADRSEADQVSANLPRSVVHSLMTRKSLVLSGGVLDSLHMQTQSLYLGLRTAVALRDGLAAGGADLQDPSAWANLTRMPHQARRLITHSFPQADPRPVAPARRDAVPRRAPSGPAAGFAPVGQVVRGVNRQPDGATCVWLPNAGQSIAHQWNGRNVEQALGLLP